MLDYTTMKANNGELCILVRMRLCVLPLLLDTVQSCDLHMCIYTCKVLLKCQEVKKTVKYVKIIGISVKMPIFHLLQEKSYLLLGYYEIPI